MKYGIRVLTGISLATVFSLVGCSKKEVPEKPEPATKIEPAPAGKPTPIASTVTTPPPPPALKVSPNPVPVQPKKPVPPPTAIKKPAQVGPPPQTGKLTPPPGTTKVPAPAPAKAAADEFVVQVNGQRLKPEDLAIRTQGMLRNQNLGNLPPEFQEQYRKQMAGRVIDGFINEHLLLGEADKQKIVPDQTKVGEYLEQLKATLPPNTTIEQALAANGTTMDRVMQDIQRDLKIRTLVDTKKEAIPAPSDKEVADTYAKDIKKYTIGESAQARHILLKVDPAADEAAKAATKTELEDIRKKLLEGADFAETAKQVSHCPSKAKGGDLGSFGRGQMVKPFEEAVFSQEINDVGSVIETRFGYHIIQVTKRDVPRTKPLEEVKEDIADELRQGQLNTVMQDYLAALRKTAAIEYGAGYEPPPARPPQGSAIKKPAPKGTAPKQVVTPPVATPPKGTAPKVAPPPKPATPKVVAPPKPAAPKVVAPPKPAAPKVVVPPEGATPKEAAPAPAPAPAPSEQK